MYSSRSAEMPTSRRSVRSTVGPFCREGLISAAAQQMTQEQSSAAHVRVLCAEAGGDFDDGRRGGPGGAEEIVVMTKCDKCAGLSSPTLASSQAGKPDVLSTAPRRAKASAN